MKPHNLLQGFEDHSLILDIITSQMVDMVYYKDRISSMISEQ
jgi:hypothetical protein